jgi:DNA adenine methylase
MERALIYCDGPYKDTTGYGNNEFNYDEYYEWLRNKAKEGHIVLISEYDMPNDFVCVWSKDIRNQMIKANDRTVEKLFVHESQLELYKKSYPDAEV